MDTGEHNYTCIDLPTHTHSKDGMVTTFLIRGRVNQQPKDNQCPYVLIVSSEYIQNKLNCVKDRHSHGDHESESGTKWQQVDSRHE